MAFKFGSLFDDIGAGFKKSMDAVGRKFEDSMKGADISGVENAKQALENLKNASQAAADVLNDVKEEYKNGNRTLRDVQDAENNLRLAREAETAAVSALAKEYEDLVEVELRAVGISSGYKKSISDINREYIEGVKNLQRSVKSQDEYNKGLKRLKFDMMGKKLQAGLAQPKEATEDMLSSVSNMIGNGLSKIHPLLGVAWQVIEKTIVATVKQMFELNDTLVKLQRTTGGVVTAASLGYDAFGNSIKGFKSLKTATIEANVSLEEFSEGIKSLVDDSFGATIGGVKIATGELQEFGIEAAKMKKYYGADIGPTVRRLYQDYGMSVQKSTKFLAQASDKALGMGLNVAGFVKNFEAVAELVGQVYFKTNAEMQKMATIATQLGVSVGAIGQGLLKMNGITDLFSQQQRNAALGLNSTAKALAQIYALKAQGKSGEAAQLEFASLAKDMIRAGFTDKTGSITQQGIATLDAAGITKEAIAGIQKMAREAKASGIDIGKLGDVTKLSVDEQKRLAEIQKNNMTTNEKLEQSWKTLQQEVLDPLAEAFAPVLEFIVDALVDAVHAIKFFINGLKYAYYKLTFQSDKAEAVSQTMQKALFDDMKKLAAKNGVVINKSFEDFQKSQSGQLATINKTEISMDGLSDMFSGAIKRIFDFSGGMDQITKGFQTWSSKWPWSKLFGKETVTPSAPKEKLPTSWEEIYGKLGGHGASNIKPPSTPAAKIKTGLRAPSNTIEEAKATNNYIGGNQKPSTTNVVVNTNVDPAFGEKNSIKFSV